MIHIGHVREIVRYPVKSMAGVPTESAMLGWHGLDGDRRFAFRRIGDDSAFPWLTASRLPELVLYQPVGLDNGGGVPLPTHVRTPNGAPLHVPSAELDAEISERFGSPVELMHLKHGIFDEAAISVISLATIAGIAREAGMEDLDRRRFRANLVLETERSELFFEDEWIGGMLVFGDAAQPPAVNVTMPDLRCVMVNLDPETAAKDSRVMKTVVRLNQNNAGVYATVLRTGPIHVGDRVSWAAERPIHTLAP
ncbi:MAG TPA: MOSC domain-containing protein [Pyrinomonadaceae bacterium]|nr:MOSC domain-containing protein [Pyrinomonadaceae bacterium]